MAKSSFEKALEKHQKEIARQVKRQIDAEKKLADKQKRGVHPVPVPGKKV